MKLRPYQEEAVNAIESGWNEYRKQLLVLPTGTGKTVVFSKVADDVRDRGVLIMAHRDELIEQARDKYANLTGDIAGKIKAADNYILPVTVGSVQTLIRRELAWNPHTIIVDEAHHALSDSYQNILNRYPMSNVLGVTATPDRGDKKSLGRYFDNLAYEYSLKQAIDDGYLCKMVARTVPLQIDLNSVKVRVGDFEVNSIAETLEPYLPQIARAIKEYAGDRKTVVFLPLVSIAQEFTDILNSIGLNAREVNGNSPNRKETIEWFDKAGKGSVLCNAMLLTEGWDCPSVDCVVVLRPTKIRSLYVQMIGRGTRLSQGKKNLLILDFLWMSQRHNLCRPTDLAADNEEDQKVVQARSEQEEIDLFDAVSDAVEARRNKLAEELRKQANKKSKLIDPVQYFVELGDMGLADYEPYFKWEYDAPSQKQIDLLSKYKINTDNLTKGSATKIISKILDRQKKHLSTPKQISCLKRFGYKDVELWSFDLANKKISELAAVGWKSYRLAIPPEAYQWTIDS